MGLKSENDRKIKAGFKRLGILKDTIIENGMRRLMNDAMMVALATHDHDHWFHKSTDNSYGWLVLHDGAHVDHRTNTGRHGEGSAYTELMRASESAPKTGWVGILLADMGEVHDNKKGKYYLFHLDYEINILELTRQDIEEQFDTYFKPL